MKTFLGREQRQTERLPSRGEMLQRRLFNGREHSSRSRSRKGEVAKRLTLGTMWLGMGPQSLPDLEGSFDRVGNSPLVGRGGNLLFPRRAGRCPRG